MKYICDGGLVSVLWLVVFSVCIINAGPLTRPSVKDLLYSQCWREERGERYDINIHNTVQISRWSGQGQSWAGQEGQTTRWGEYQTLSSPPHLSVFPAGWQEISFIENEADWGSFSRVDVRSH